jgi:peptide chain release factor 3
MDLAEQAARRRTYAIISHPDAGKTTLTEKLLLYSGAIHLAGSVRGRKASRLAVSDWMKMEQERGISITSSVLQFEYLGSALNLLDTPGHADFSEDTYRTLAAVDSAVMLLDHTKGVESRTKKLFEVCRMRQLPIVSFMNKLDRPGLDPLELVDEVGETFNLKVAPMNWPIGMGQHFRGVVEMATKKVLLFSGGKHGQTKVETETTDLAGARERLGDVVMDEVEEQLELIEGAGEAWDPEAFYAGELTPMFWGSAMSNFGVEPLLTFLAEHAAPPAHRKGRIKDEIIDVAPEEDSFTGFIFKIQANMNPRHRDRLAFMRVVSGRFHRGMDTIVGRSGEALRLSKPHTFMAQERSIVEEAWPGDIVGLYDPGKLRIGDTLAEGRRLAFDGIPRFAPEHFSRVVLEDPMKRKQLDNGLEQLAHEGVIQVFVRPDIGRQQPWLGAVGVLQFEVLKERLKNEYRVGVRLEPLPYRLARWIEAGEGALEWLRKRREYKLLEDRNGNPVLLAEAEWAVDFAARTAPNLVMHDIEPL